MSSTNVPYVRVADVVPTDREVIIPPNEAKEFKIEKGYGNVEITTENVEVREGKAFTVEGNKEIMLVDEKRLKTAREARRKSAPSRYGKLGKEMEI